MIKTSRTILAVLALCLHLTACSISQTETTDTTPPTTLPHTTAPTVPTTTAETTIPETTVTTEPVTQPAITPEYLDQIILYFNEVCLDAEISDGGDPSKVQKWVMPLLCSLHGDYTEADKAVIEDFMSQLNTIPGFPGIGWVDEKTSPNMRIWFGTQDEMISLMGEHTAGFDGTVTFWYDQDEIYSCDVFVRTELDQMLRNSIILEEIYNGLGPIQDTSLRPDSIIYEDFSQPQALTETDLLILQLLYDPQIQCGMDSSDCEKIIRNILMS